MATARIVDNRPKSDPPKKPEEGTEVILTLNPDEARFLRTMTGRLTGGGLGRHCANNIFHALVNAQVSDDLALIRDLNSWNWQNEYSFS